jgi:hypothetical protein
MRLRGISSRCPAGRWWASLGASRKGWSARGSSLSTCSIRRKCAEVFGGMGDVTHVVYAALYEKPGLIAGWRERDQMETNLRMLRNLFDPLVATQRDCST